MFAFRVYEHNAGDDETRLPSAACDAVDTKAQKPARFIVEHLLHDKPEYSDDAAVLTILFE